MAFDRCQGRTQFMADRCQQRRLELVELALTRHIAQQETAPNGLP